MPSPPSDLTRHLGYWLRFVSNSVSQSFARRVAEKDVTVAEWVFMRILYARERMSPSVLASEMGMTRGAISKLADRLIAKKLIVRTANPEDGRAHTLALTKSARVLVPQLAALADENDSEFFEHMTSKDRSDLERILKEIVARRGLSAKPID